MTHGTVAGYTRGRCREECCRSAYRRWRKKWEYERDHGMPRMIDATGTHRRLQALIAIGWGWDGLGREAGITGSAMRRTLASPTISRGLAEKIATLYGRLSMRKPAEDTHGQRQAASAARNRARRNGWAPPLAWDDIDDPNEQPDLGGRGDAIDEVAVRRRLEGDKSVRLNRAEQDEVVRTWMAAGKPLNELDRLTGINARRILRRMEAA